MPEDATPSIATPDCAAVARCCSSGKEEAIDKDWEISCFARTSVWLTKAADNKLVITQATNPINTRDRIRFTDRIFKISAWFYLLLTRITRKNSIPIKTKSKKINSQSKPNPPGSNGNTPVWGSCGGWVVEVGSGDPGGMVGVGETGGSIVMIGVAVCVGGVTDGGGGYGVIGVEVGEGEVIVAVTRVAVAVDGVAEGVSGVADGSTGVSDGGGMGVAVDGSGVSVGVSSIAVGVEVIPKILDA